MFEPLSAFYFVVLKIFFMPTVTVYEPTC